MTTRIPAHGGTLRNNWCAQEYAEALKATAATLASFDLNRQQLSELELLLDGALSPLGGYHTEAEFRAVEQHQRLPDGTLWPVPISLVVTPELPAAPGEQIALRDFEGVLVAVLAVSDRWTDANGACRLGGAVTGVDRTGHHDFPELWETPAQLRERTARAGWTRILGFATDSVLSRAEHAMLESQASILQANLLIQIAATIPDPGDMTHYARVRAIQHAVQAFVPQTATLMMRPGVGLASEPRQLLLRMIIAQNYGCTHLVHTADVATPEGAQELAISALSVPSPVWSEAHQQFLTVAQPPADAETPPDEATVFDAIEQERPIPDWWSWPRVLRELRRAITPRSRQGFTLLFTGFSGSGKSTVAQSVMARLLAVGTRRATLLDGDVVRHHLSSELGFSREHRNINVLRIGYVASEITKFGGIAICAPIAPYADTRAQMRAMVEAHGGFIEIHISTPLEVCEARDRKGLYARARRGEIPEFTGISDPYDVPETPELRIDTTHITSDEAAQQVLLKLRALGYLSGEPDALD